MHAVTFGRRDELADVVEAFGGQPPLAAATLHGKTVGGFLVGAAKLMTAFMREDPHFDRRGDLVHQFRIENQEARVSRAVVVELAVEHNRALAALCFLAVEAEIARVHDLGAGTNVRGIFFRRRTGRRATVETERN